MATTTQTSQNKTYQGGAREFAALIGGSVALALGPWLVRLADTGPVSAGFWRLALPIPLLVLLSWRELARSRPSPAQLGWVIFAGIFFALDIAAWHIGIELTRLGNSTLFGNSGSLLLMIWGLVVLRRRPVASELAAVMAAVLGGAILMGRSLEISADTLRGDLYCLLAGIFYVAYLLPAQRVRAQISLWTVMLIVSLSAAPVLFLVAVWRGEPVWPGDAGWAPVVGLVILSQLLGQGLLVYALRHFPPLVVGLSLLVQPAVAAASGWLAFGETLAPLDILGMVLVGAALVAARRAA